MQYIAITFTRSGLRFMASHRTARDAVYYVRRAVRGSSRHGFGGRGYVLRVPAGVSLGALGFVVHGVIYRFDCEVL